MPFVRITLRDDTAPETQRAVSDGVHRALVDALGIPDGDHFQVIDRRPADSIIADPAYLGVDRQNPMFVEITMVRGRSVEMKKALYQAIAKQVVSAGLRADDVLVMVREANREDWSLGNGEAQILDTELLRRHGWTPPAG